MEIYSEAKKLGAPQYVASVALSLATATLLGNKVSAVAKAAFNRHNFFGSMISGVILGAISHQVFGDKAFGKGNEGRKSVCNMGYLLGLINLIALGADSSLIRAVNKCPMTAGLYTGLLATHLVVTYT